MIKRRRILSIFIAVLMLCQVPPLNGLATDAPEVIYSSPISGATYYTVRFLDHDGSLLATQYVQSGKQAKKPESPVREAYQFTGWSPNPEAVISADTDFIAQYAAIEKYKVTIRYVKTNAEGGEVAPPFIGYYERGRFTEVSVSSPAFLGYEPEYASITIKKADFDETGEYETHVTYTPCDLVNYTVKHYLEISGIVGAPSFPGDFEAASPAQEVFQGRPYENVQASSLSSSNLPAGFEVNTQETKTIQPDGSTVVASTYRRVSTNLVFFTDGGTSVPSQTGKYGASVVAPADPTRLGYDFAGWYSDAGLTVAATLPSTFPAANRNFYAKWNPKTVNYKYVYWVEKANVAPNGADAGTSLSDYAYYSETTATGIAGTAVTGAPPAITGVTGILQDRLVYHHHDQNAVVDGDGSTIVNVFYARKVYSISFAYTGTMSRSGTNYNNGAYIIRVKPEENLKDRWPCADTGFTFSQGTLSRWTSAAQDLATNPVTANEQVLKSSVYSAVFQTGNIIKVYYWFEKYQGQTGTEKVYNGVTYIKSEEYSQMNLVADAGCVTDKAILGMTVVYNSLYTELPDQHLYYKRNRNTLTFDTRGGASLATVSNVLYAEPLSRFNPNWTEAQTKAVGGITYTFAGWYVDGNYNESFDFATATMPNNALTIYAKWLPKRVTVTFDAQNGATSPYATASTRQGSALNALSLPADPVRENYAFDGWYKGAAAYSQYFSPEEVVTEDLKVYAHWRSKPTTYTIQDELSNGTKLRADRTVNGATGQTVTVTALPYSGYRLTSENPQTILLVETAAKNVIRFEYERINSYRYTVRYVQDADTTQKLLPDESYTTPDEQSHIAVSFKPISGWYPVQAVLEASLTDGGENAITFRYTRYVTVNYTVSHYKQKLDGSYSATPTDREIKTARLYDTAVGNAMAYGAYYELVGDAMQRDLVESATDTIAFRFDYKMRDYVENPTDPNPPDGYVRVIFQSGTYGNFGSGVTSKTIDVKKTLTWASIKSLIPAVTVTTAGFGHSGWSPNIPADASVVADGGYTAQYADNVKPEPPKIGEIVAGDRNVDGTGESGATVTVTFPDGTEATGTVDENGNWTVPVPESVTLKKDDVVTATQTDESDNKSDPDTETVVSMADKYEPTAVGETIEKGGSYDLLDNITNKAELPAGTTYSDVTPAGTINVNKVGTYPGKVQATYPDGSFEIVDVPVTVRDTTKPEPPKIGEIVAGDRNVDGTGESGATVTVTFPDGTEATGTVDENGNWTVPVPESVTLKKDDVVTATQTDESDNKSDPDTETVVSMADKYEPTAVGETIESGVLLPYLHEPIVGSKLIKGMGEPEALVKIEFSDGSTQIVQVDAFGHWEAVAPVPLKENDIIIVVQKGLGKRNCPEIRAEVKKNAE